MSTTNPRVAKWQAWLKVANNEIVGLFHDQHLFRTTMEMISSNPKLPKESVVYEWLISNYAVGAASGVRRQLDLSTDVISLSRLLNEIFNHPREITRTWFVSQYGPLPNGNRDFNTFTASPGDPYIDPTKVKQDIDALKTEGEVVRVWVNKYVAHRDEMIALGRVSSAPVLKWEDLIKAIDLLGELLKKHELLLNQAGMVKVEPIIPEPWEDVFKVPWLK